MMFSFRYIEGTHRRVLTCGDIPIMFVIEGWIGKLSTDHIPGCCLVNAVVPDVLILKWLAKTHVKIYVTAPNVGDEFKSPLFEDFFAFVFSSIRGGNGRRWGRSS